MIIKEGFQAVPYAYWFSKIKERSKGQRIVDVSLLKDIFMREIICDDNKERKGGSKKGIPKRFMYAMINDMRNMSFDSDKVPFIPLLKKTANSAYKYEISPSQEYKKILAQPFPF